MTAAARKIATAGTALGFALIAIVAVPKPAEAWWHHYGWGVGVYLPPVIVAPPPAYYPPPPSYYAPPVRAWIPAHWENGYWVPGHWA